MDRTAVNRIRCSIVLLCVLCRGFPVTSAVHLSVVRLLGSGVGNRHSVIESPPAVSLLQTPGARADATTWCDDVGHVWLFGGVGYDDTVSSMQPKLLNDLWMFNTTRLQWNLVHSGRSRNRENGTDVVPRPRRGASSCGVPGIVFVIVGGSDSKAGSLSDTWIFNLATNRWVPLSATVAKVVHPPSTWSASSSWCHEDALYVVGSSRNSAIGMWKFSLKSLEWTDESQFLRGRQHHMSVLSRPHSAEMNMITTVWNGSFYLYDWHIVHDANQNFSILSIDLQRLLSIPFTYYTNDRRSVPFLWSHLNSLHKGNISCTTSPEFPQMRQCSPDSSQSCSVHACYKIMSTPWTQNTHSNAWFYADKMYIFGGRAVSSAGAETLSSDLWVVRQSYESNYTTAELLVSLISALLAFILLGVGLFCIMRHCGEFHPLKSRTMKVRYTFLRDENSSYY